MKGPLAAIVAGALVGATLAAGALLSWVVVELVRSWTGPAGIIAAGMAMGALYGWRHRHRITEPERHRSWRADG